MKISYQKIAHYAYSKLAVSAFALFGLVSCTEDPNSPGVEFMPDMYRSIGYEAYLKKFDIDSIDFLSFTCLNITRFFCSVVSFSKS